jgi:multidrug efflux pump
VIALVIMLVRALDPQTADQPVPEHRRPAIAISVTYPGASAQTVQDTVVQVIEQQLNGIDNLRYVSSESNPTAA